MAPKGKRGGKAKAQEQEVLAPAGEDRQAEHQEETLLEDPAAVEDGAMPPQELRNMHAHLQALALRGDSAPKDYYKALSDKSKKRAFFEQYKGDKKCKFVCELIEKRTDVAQDSVEVVQGWMSKPKP